MISIFIYVERSDDPPVLGDVTDIALDHFFIPHQIDIADEFHFDHPPILRSKGEVFVANLFFIL
jgi:hypothetical protein